MLGGWIYQNTLATRVSGAATSRSLVFVDFTKPNPKAVADNHGTRLALADGAKLCSPSPLGGPSRHVGTTKPLLLRYWMTTE
jgi:hypothetical protein